MGGIGGMLGLSGGAAGTGFSAPVAADIKNPTTTEQVGQSYDQNQEALRQQQRLVDALGGQNGLQNQSSVYGQLQGVANGQGPNPAQAMLSQQTGANIQNQAALMAGQRGASSNVGLMARQAGMQGGNLQQQAVGQGATMQANQSLNALNQMGGIANTQVGNLMAGTNAYTGAQQAQQANLLNSMSGQNTANVGSTSSYNAANAGLANAQLQGQQAVVGGAMNAMGGGGAKSMMGGAHGGQVPNYDMGGDVAPVVEQTPTSAGSAPAPQATPLPAPNIGPVANGAQYGAALAAAPPMPTNLGAQPEGPQSSFGQFVSKVDAGGPAQQSNIPNMPTNGADALYKGASAMAGGGGDSGGGGGGGGMASMLPMLMALSKGGLVDVVVSPGEKLVPPEKAEKAAGGKVEAKKVPGQAKVSGDDVKNDTVKMKLPPGTIVVPRTQSNSDRDSASFVRNTLAKRGRK